MNNNTDSRKEEAKKRRIIIEITIIIIILLLFITSCTAHNYFGRIGKINKEVDTTIENDTNDLEINKNDKLTFDLDEDSHRTIYLKDGDKKISFTLHGVEAKDFSCTTSDADIATCVVKDGYIIVKPLKVGKVVITLSTEVGKTKYIAQTTIFVESSSSYYNSASNNDDKNHNKKGKKKSGSETSKTNNRTKDTGTIYHYEDNKEARLISLKVDNYQLNPVFDENNLEYIVSVPSTTTSVNISGVTKSSDAKIISGIGNVSLTGESTIVKVVVESKSGNTLTYTIKINKKENIDIISSDATLKSLDVEGYKLTPEFNSEIYRYEMTIPYSQTAINVDAVANSQNALVTIDKNTNLKVGDNEVLVKVLAENGNSKTYIIKVTRLDNEKENTNAYLRDLTVTNATINPSFNKEIYKYNVSVDSNTSSLDLTAVAEDSTATVTIAGNKDFKTGINVITINVKTIDGIEKNYQIIVNKNANSTSTLANLEVEGYNISPDFTEDNLDYNLTIPYTVDDLNVLFTKKDDKETVEITGNTNLIAGQINVVEVKVTAEDLTTTTYRINVYKKEDPSLFYINSYKSYKVGYNKNNNNYKNIIINSNILEGVITKTYENGKLILSDGKSTITLEAEDLVLDYIEDSDNSLDNAHIIKVNYNSIGNKTIKVIGTRKDIKIDEYTINFNIQNLYYVTLDANGGFFNELENSYHLSFYENEILDLIEYNEAYKKTDEDNCLVYTLSKYNTLEDGSGVDYLLTDNINITSDMTLYAIYDETNTTTYTNVNQKLYLTDVDIFELDDGTKGLIYPGTQGSYVMHIKNTTDSKLTIKTMNLEEDSICVDGSCLNMGYIVKYTDDSTNGYKYYLGNNNSYKILKDITSVNINNPDGTVRHATEINLDGIVLNPQEETEISLLWKWVDDDASDTKIGNYVAEHEDNNTYYITVSFTFDKEDKSCEGN